MIKPAINELPDDLRVPLHELQADIRYLIARARQEDDEGAAMVIDSIIGKLSQIETAAYRLANPDAVTDLHAIGFREGAASAVPRIEELEAALRQFQCGCVILCAKYTGNVSNCPHGRASMALKK